MRKYAVLKDQLTSHLDWLLKTPETLPRIDLLLHVQTWRNSSQLTVSLSVVHRGCSSRKSFNRTNKNIFLERNFAPFVFNHSILDQVT